MDDDPGPLVAAGEQPDESKRESYGARRRGPSRALIEVDRTEDRGLRDDGRSGRDSASLGRCHLFIGRANFSKN